MRRALRHSLLLATFAAAAGPALGDSSVSDRITWVRQDGAAGWQASIDRDTRPAGRTPSPLVAPNWFPRIPPLSLRLASGGTLDLGGTRGRVVLLDFWASWCGPCLQELPHLQRLHVAEAPRGLLAIAINADEPAEVAAASAKRLGLGMTVALNDAKLYETFGVHTLPTVLLVDKQGRVRGRWDGYRPGLETTIAQMVAKLIADDPEGTRREVASVLRGAGALRAIWLRDLPGTADGIVALPPSAGEGLRVIASSGGLMIAFDRRGEATARSSAPPWAGRLVDFGDAADGSREIVGYRPGATSLGVIDLRSGIARPVEAAAPVVDAAVDVSVPGDGRRMGLVTLQGTALVAPRGELLGAPDGSAPARDVAARVGGGLLALAADGSIAPIAPAGAPWPTVTAGAFRLLGALPGGAAVGPRTVVASVMGRFLPGRRDQLAVATYAGHLALLDAADGTLLFDAAWPDVSGLAAQDLDGDGLDELVVASGHQIAALSAAAGGPGAGAK